MKKTLKTIRTIVSILLIALFYIVAVKLDLLGDSTLPVQMGVIWVFAWIFLIFEGAWNMILSLLIKRCK